MNMSDIGPLEPQAYSLFFAASFLKFIRRPNTLTFFTLCLTASLLAISANYNSFAWNMIAVPLFLVTVSFIPQGNFEWVKRAFSSIPFYQRILFLGLVLLCFLPNVMTLLQNNDLVKPAIGTEQYAFQDMAKGNPLEMLTVSLPGFGFNWNDLAKGLYKGQWKLFSGENGYPVSYGYLGLLSLPLATMGLLFGRPSVRNVLFLMLAAVFSITVLSGYSPFFASLLVWPTPFRSFNHYGDFVYRTGGYLLLIFCAGLGLETFLKEDLGPRKALVKLFCFSSLLSVILYLVVFGKRASEILELQLLLLFSYLFFIILFWLGMAKTRNHLKITTGILLGLTMIDVSTYAFIYARKNLFQNARFVEEAPAANLIGLKEAKDPDFYANSLLMSRSLLQMKKEGFNPEKLPSFQLGKGNGEIQVLHQTYNDLDLKVFSKHKAPLFVRDGYSPYWKAKVNGEAVPITRALHYFKAVEVPEGVSLVSFRFSPPWIGFSLGIAYGVISFVGIFLIYLRRVKTPE